jgi:hypothetical protein
MQRKVNNAVIVWAERLGGILDSQDRAKGVDGWLPEG